MSAVEKFLSVVARIESEGYRVLGYEQHPGGRWAFVVEDLRKLDNCRLRRLVKG